MKYWLLLFLGHGLCSLQGQERVPAALLQNYRISVKIKPLRFELVGQQLDSDTEYEKYQYTIPQLSQQMCFYRQWYRSLDTVLFLNKKYLLVGDRGYPFEASELRLDSNVKFYWIQFQKEQYLCFETSLMGATGSGSRCSRILLFFSLNKSIAPSMSCVVACNFEWSHLIDYHKNGTLDLVYYNWKGKLNILELGSNQFVK